MLITLWWKAWSWKWTVGKLLAEKLNYEIISIWDMKRKLAAEMQRVFFIWVTKTAQTPKASEPKSYFFSLPRISPILKIRLSFSANAPDIIPATFFLGHSMINAAAKTAMVKAAITSHRWELSPSFT